MIVFKNGTYRNMTPEEASDYVMCNQQTVYPTSVDRLEAQVQYTALMTDTLIGEEEICLKS